MKRYTNKEVVFPTDVMVGEEFKAVNTLHVPRVYDYYMVSTHGRVWHKYLGIYLKPGINGGGYKYVMMSTYDGAKPVQIHRLVMIVFDPIMNYNALQVNHQNGNKFDNYMGNLEWVTCQENIIHAYNHDLMHTGEDHPTARISNEQAQQIISLLPKVNTPAQDRLTSEQIAKMVGGNVTATIVDSIRKKESWTQFSEGIEFYQRPNRLFTEQDVICLCEYFQTYPKGNLTINDHCRNALISINKDPSDSNVETVRKIYSKKYYPKITSQYNFI